MARPSAHGQAMISTDIAALNAARDPAPIASHTIRVISAIPKTDGTNHATTLSTSVCTDALRACACSASTASWASCVCAPTFSASTTRAPVVLVVPPSTRSPTVTSIGAGSPVIADVSIADVPTSTWPSVAIRSPGRTTNRSPTLSEPIGTSCSTPSLTTRTVFGASWPMASSTPRADRFERAST